MMTLNQAERLVRKIAEAISQPGSDTQTAKLAQDYAEVCRAANRRLEQCAIMIEAGQFLQALQLAETPPPLLDLITLLTFRQAAEWRNYCHSHQLPSPDPFYDKYIRLLNNAYGKGIASDHPFYRDYRRAIMENDDARALSILRVISRLNPSDENTREELKRLEDKILRVKLESLRQVVATGDAAAIEATLEQLEATGLPVPASHPTWQQAQIARCQQMLRRAEQLREQGSWQEVETIVEEIQSLAMRYNLRLPDADAEAWTALEEWSGQQRGAFVAEQDFKRAVSALEYEVRSVSSQRASNLTLDKAAATIAYSTLEGKWQEAQRFGRPLSEELISQYEECDDWLQERIEAANRRRRLIAALIGSIVLGAIAAVVPYLLGLERQREFSRELQRLESARSVSRVEAALQTMPDSWKNNYQMEEPLRKAKDFVAQEEDLKKAFDQRLAGLDATARAGFQNNLAETGTARAGCEQALDQIAPEFQSGRRNALKEWDSKWQTFRNAQIDGLLNQADAAAERLNSTNGANVVRTAMEQIQARLSDLGPFKTQPPVLEPALVDRISSLSNKVEVWTAATDNWEKTREAMKNTQSPEQHLAALDQMVASPFATLAQRDAVAAIDRLKINQQVLLGQLLLPNNPSAWPSLTNVTGWSTSLMPEQPTSQEKDLYFKLRDDKNVRDVNAYELITNSRAGNPYHSHPIFVQGSIAPNNAGDEAGMVHDPALYQDSLHFVQTSYSDWNYIKIQRMYRTQECDTYEKLGLGDLIDANTGNYQKPILQIFDQLNRDNKSSAVFRAYVIFRLLAVAQLRPDEWGFTWCPSSAAEIQALTQLGAKDIQSGDWMVPERSDKFDGPFQKYFAQARVIPLEKQARFLEQLTRDACLKGFTFAGFIDASGHPVLQPQAMLPGELCGWSKSGSATVLFRKAAGAGDYVSLADPLPYSPLFVFNGDRRELLLQTLAATGYPSDLASPILPPFFEGTL